MMPMTPKKLNVLLAFRAWQENNVFPPTIRDVASLIRVSPATAQEHINILYYNGYLERFREGEFPRNYHLSKKSLELINEHEERIKNEKM